LVGILITKLHPLEALAEKVSNPVILQVDVDGRNGRWQHAGATGFINVEYLHEPRGKQL
jgi:hypothetical protein